MKTSGKLVIDSAARHLFQSCGHNLSHLFFAGARVPVEQQIDDGRMRKFRSLTEAAIFAVKRAQRRLHHLLHNPWREVAAVSEHSLRVRQRVH